MFVVWYKFWFFGFFDFIVTIFRYFVIPLLLAQIQQKFNKGTIAGKYLTFTSYLDLIRHLFID
jgi:hypothetical protein